MANVSYDGAYDPVVTFSGGKNTFTFNATAGGAVGDIVIVAVACHSSAGAFGAVSGWNFLGCSLQGDYNIPAMFALYWRVRQSGDTSYVFQSGTTTALDVNAAGQMIYVRNAKSQFDPVSVMTANGREGSYNETFAPLESMPKFSTVASITAAAGELILGFCFKNWYLLNTQQFGELPLTYTYNNADAVYVLSMSSIGSALWQLTPYVGGGPYPVMIQSERFSAVAPPFINQDEAAATWAVLVLKQKKTGGLFGVNH